MYNKITKGYDKVPNTWHTGRDNVKYVGGLARYKGEETLKGMWPEATIPIKGGAAAMGSTIQYGFSDGKQFPPGNVITSSTPLLVFFNKFQLPLIFDYKEETETRGIRLLRYTLSPTIFSPQRPDARFFSMAVGITPEGVFNLTDTQQAPMFLSEPHFSGGGDDLLWVKGITADPGRNLQSYLDVEPITGKTMDAKVRMQVSTSTWENLPVAYDVYHPDVYKGKNLHPIMWMSQESTIGHEDALYFKSQVYETQSIISHLTVVVLMVAGISFLLGPAIFWLLWESTTKNGGADEDDDDPGKQLERTAFLGSAQISSSSKTQNTNASMAYTNFTTTGRSMFEEDVLRVTANAV